MGVIFVEILSSLLLLDLSFRYKEKSLTYQDKQKYIIDKNVVYDKEMLYFK